MKSRNVVSLSATLFSLLASCCIQSSVWVGAKSTNTKEHRSLQTIDNCSINDQLLQTAECVPLSTFLQNAGMVSSMTDFATRLTIPCGQCVRFVSDGDYNYVFRDGLDIRGKLEIDCHSSAAQSSLLVQSTSIVIQSTAVIVQGQLVIDATCKPIDGKALVQFKMVDKDAAGSSTTFVPMSTEILSRCGGTICNIGSKSITVAGGKVDINGIPNESMLTWVNLHNVTYVQSVSTTRPMGIVLKVFDVTQITSSWSIGSTILITSFTPSYNLHQQVRKIVQISSRITGFDGTPSSGPNSGFVDVLLDQPITKPTTFVDDPNFAVEVALLSRNVLFTATLSGRDLSVGGHFWFFFTHNKEQKIQGIEIENFGQQGVMGRYPIHIHHCQNLTTGQVVVSKNTIRQSQQRCIVIHGSNNVMITENIAYDTFGHCFMLEDGIEIGNTFYRNLGALTKVPKYIIPTSITANNGEETDAMASTYWITNTRNNFHANVAAGSQSTGFWFELLKRGIFANQHPGINPKRDPLALFSDNVAHSNGDKGMRTYPTGYRPDVLATFNNLKVFRNGGQGFFFHLSSNIDVTNSLFADNGISIDFDRTFSPPLRLRNVKIIGETDNFRTNVRSNRLGTVCRVRQNIGLEIRSYLQNVGSSTAYSIDNVQFSGFDHGSCTYAQPISVESEITDGTMMFNSYTSMSNISFGNSLKISSIDFCRTLRVENNVTNVYITDIDGSLKPNTVLGTVKTPASVVSLHPHMLQFLDTTKCTNVPSQCLSYCQDTCYRGIIYEVDPSFTQNFTLKICKKSLLTNCITIQGHRRTDIVLLEEDSRYFGANLPLGEYDAVFLNELGQETFPSFARKLATDVTCPKTDPHNIVLRAPPVTYSQCVELIRNGNIEMSQIGIPLHWLAQGRFLGQMKLYPLGGVGGSNALISVTSGRTIFVQYLDTRCLQRMIGSEYTLSARFKLLGPSEKVVVCNSSKERCPEIGIFTEDSGFQVASTFILGMLPTSAGFETISGRFRITNELVEKTVIRLYIQSFSNKLVVDNVSMKLSNETGVSAPTTAPIASGGSCTNMVANSDMELGHVGYWKAASTDVIATVNPGYQSQTALKYTKASTMGPELITSARNFNRTCMTSTTTTWIVSAQLQLIRKGSNNIGFACTLTTNCPELNTTIRETGGRILLTSRIRSYLSTTWTANAFNSFQATIRLPVAPSSSYGQITIGFGSYPSNAELIFDNFVVQPM